MGGKAEDEFYTRKINAFCHAVTLCNGAAILASPPSMGLKTDEQVLAKHAF